MRSQQQNHDEREHFSSRLSDAPNVSFGSKRVDARPPRALSDSAFPPSAAMSELATTHASPDLAAKAERRRQKFALKEWEGSATRAAHDARVRSAKSQYADIFRANGNTPGARRFASPAGAPATPAPGSHATAEMTRRARRTPPSHARLARTPETPESASGGRNLDAALAVSPSRETPGSRIRAAAAIALSPDSAYRAERFGRRTWQTNPASATVATPSPDRGSGAARSASSPLGPESSPGGSRLARRGSSRSPASRLPFPPAARRTLGDVASEPATPLAPARDDAAPRPGSSARPSAGRNLARFLKRRQALRRAEAKEAEEAKALVDANKENVDPAWAEYETCLAAAAASPGEGRARGAAPRAPLAPLAVAGETFAKENRAPIGGLVGSIGSVGSFVERATAAQEAASAPRARGGSSDSSSPPPRAASKREPFFVRDDDEDAFPPTPAESPSPLRAVNAETHAAWIERGYGAIRASAAAAAPRYAEDGEPESGAGRDEDDDAWNEYAGASATFGGFDEAHVEPFKMVSPGALRRATATTARSASFARYA